MQSSLSVWQDKRPLHENFEEGEAAAAVRLRFRHHPIRVVGSRGHADRVKKKKTAKNIF